MALRDATFLRMENARFVLQTDRGEWKMFPFNRGLAAPPPNSPVKFSARKDDKGYWRLEEIYVSGQQPIQSVGAAAQAPLGHGPGAGPAMGDPAVMAAQKALEDAQRAAAAKAAEQERQHPTVGVKDRTHPDDSRAMFVMGVVGRAMGSGKFEAVQIGELTIAAMQAWDAHILGKPTGARPVQYANAPQATQAPAPAYNGPADDGPAWPGPQPGEAAQDYVPMTGHGGTPPAWEPPPHEDDGRS